MTEKPAQKQPQASSRVSRLTRTPGGRRHVVKVLLTDEELLALEARAAVGGVSRQRLMIEAALTGDHATASERRALIAEFTGALRLLGRVGNNVNQLAKVANASGEMPPELAATLNALNRFMRRLDAAAGRVAGPTRGAK